jgi:hypothetical protein
VATLPPATITLRPWLKGTKNDAPSSRRLVSSPVTGWKLPVKGRRKPTRTADPPNATPVKNSRPPAVGSMWG